MVSASRLAAIALVLLWLVGSTGCARQRECSKRCQQSCAADGCTCVDDRDGKCQCKCWD